jgi:hypothetical protein
LSKRLKMLLCLTQAMYYVETKFAGV